MGASWRDPQGNSVGPVPWLGVFFACDFLWAAGHTESHIIAMWLLWQLELEAETEATHVKFLYGADLYPCPSACLFFHVFLTLLPPTSVSRENLQSNVIKLRAQVQRQAVTRMQTTV
jgi:hypothetical protein